MIKFISAVMLLFGVFSWHPAQTVSAAQFSATPVNILLLVDNSYYASRGSSCSIYRPKDQRSFLRFVDSGGRQKARAAFDTGSIVQMPLTDGTRASFCSFVQTVPVRTPAKVTLDLNGMVLTQLIPGDATGDNYLMLQVSSGGMEYRQIVTESFLTENGLGAPDAANTNANQNSNLDATGQISTSALPSGTEASSTAESTGPGLQADGKYRIEGVLELTDSNVVYSDGVCNGQQDFSDIFHGKQVVVRDESGNILGFANMYTLDTSVDGSKCVYGFEMEVPEAESYVISVGDLRGGLLYSHDELTSEDWTIRLTLGGS